MVTFKSISGSTWNYLLKEGPGGRLSPLVGSTGLCRSVIHAAKHGAPPGHWHLIENWHDMALPTRAVAATHNARSSDVIRFTPAFSIAVQAAASEPLVSIPRQASSTT